MQPAYAASKDPLLRRARGLLEGTPALIELAKAARLEAAELTARLRARRRACEPAMLPHR
jgi:hypothetical protein